MKCLSETKKVGKKTPQSEGAKYVDERLTHLLECFINDNYEPGAKLAVGIASFAGNIPNDLAEDIRNYCINEVTPAEPLAGAPTVHRRDTSVGAVLDHATQLLMNSFDTRRTLEVAALATPEPVAKKARKAGNHLPHPITPTQFVVSDVDLNLFITETNARILKQNTILQAAKAEKSRRLKMARKIVFEHLVSALCEE